MGLYEDVQDMINRMGLGMIATNRTLTFPGLTYEFLATVELIYADPGKKTASEATLRFKIENKHYSVPMFDVCDALGFAKNNKVKFPKLECANEFWDSIAFGDYATRSAKAAKIRNPVLRYCHKLIANTIVARHDTSMVRKDELNLLFQGLKHTIRNKENNLFEDTLGDDVNLGCILASEFLAIQAHAHKVSEPNINIGGMITLILQRAGVDLSLHYGKTRAGVLDYNYLVKCRFLKNTDDKTIYSYSFMSRDKVKRTYALPDVEKTSIKTLENIYFHYEGELDIAKPSVPPREDEPREEREAEQEESIQEERDVDELQPPPGPEFPFKPQGKREKLMYKAYKAQVQVNKWCINMIKKLHRKMKRTPEYASSGEEEVEEEKNEEQGEEQEEEGHEAKETQDAPTNEDWYDEEMALDDELPLHDFIKSTKKRSRSTKNDGASSSHP